MPARSPLDRLNALASGEIAEMLAGDPGDRAAVLRIAAEGGAVDAQLLLGQMHLEGAGGDLSPVEALRWFGRAAAAGHPMGMNMLGRCLEHGWGTAIDTLRAATWYRAAADRGLDWGMYNLATLLALGDGVPLDRAKALALFRQAAVLGHAKSMTMVGSFYEDGWAVEPSRIVAAAWYRRGAEGGDFRGQFNTARVLADAGRIDAAIAWLCKIPETATRRFLDQVHDWLAARPEKRLRELVLDPRQERRYESDSH